tara:strand:+ start:25 stop:222 length:198 start_codon:yes stop_codon:yes gene_type:complete
MPRKPKKPRKYKPGKYQFIVRPDGPIIRIEDYPYKNLPAEFKKPTLHSQGGLIKGKPKLTKKGYK